MVLLTRLAVGAALALCACPGVLAQQPAPALGPHPRLILTEPRLAAMKAAVADNADAGALYALLLEHADWVVRQPVQPQPAPGPSGILIAVRGCLDYLFTTAIAFKLGGNATYLARAVQEGDNLASWTDWNPAHFLDTGEASVTMALAYDWLYHDVDEATRGAWTQAVLVKGLQQYRTAFLNHTQFWVNATMNWNCVCSSGAITSVLGLLGEPGVTDWVWADVLLPAQASVPPCLRNYQPEGSWDESSGYWAYASQFNVISFSVLQSALGSDAGYADLPGVQAGGTFPLHMTGPSGLIFDWADSWQFWSTQYGANYSTTVGFAQWWGDRYGDGVTAFYARQTSLTQVTSLVEQDNQQWGELAFALLWFTDVGAWEDVQALPRCYAYMQRYLGVFRSDWHWPWDGTGVVSAGSALFLKGGNTGLTHQHEDLGSWQWETNATRVVFDLGADNYNLPDYFGPTRWDYYRLNSRGHNVLTFGSATQGASSVAPLVTFNTSGPGCVGTTFSSAPAVPAAPPVLDGWALVNLTKAYPSVTGLAGVMRGYVSLQNTGTVVIVDEITHSSGGGGLVVPNVSSTLHTFAQVSIDAGGTTATLYINGTRAYLGVLGASQGGACPGATLSATPILLPAPQYASAGLVQVDAVSTTPSTCTRLALVLSGTPLGGSGWPASAVLQPMADWPSAGPVTTDAGAVAA